MKSPIQTSLLSMQIDKYEKIITSKWYLMKEVMSWMVFGCDGYWKFSNIKSVNLFLTLKDPSLNTSSEKCKL